MVNRFLCPFAMLPSSTMFFLTRYSRSPKSLCCFLFYVLFRRYTDLAIVVHSLSITSLPTSLPAADISPGRVRRACFLCRWSLFESTGPEHTKGPWECFICVISSTSQLMKILTVPWRQVVERKSMRRASRGCDAVLA